MKIPTCPYCGFGAHRIRLFYDTGRIKPKLTAMKGIRCNHCLWTSRLSRFWWLTILRWKRRDGSMTTDQLAQRRLEIMKGVAK